MVTLSDPHGRRLELRPVRYQFPDGVGTGDDNWVLVDMYATDGAQEWSASGATLLTHELTDLALWIRDLADGKVTHPGDPDYRPEWLAWEQDLYFYARGTGDACRLRAHIRVADPTARGGSTLVELEFEPSSDDLRQFADALWAEAQHYPDRA